MFLRKTSYQRLYLLLQQAKVEDRKALVKHIDTLIQLFAKMEEKMHASDTRQFLDETLALRQTLQQAEERNTSDTMALRQTAEKNAAETMALRQAIGEFANKFAKLEDENATLKKMMEKVLKAPAQSNPKISRRNPRMFTIPEEEIIRPEGHPKIEKFRLACYMVKAGRMFLLNDPLRQLLDRVSRNVQIGLEDNAAFCACDLALLCVDEIEKSVAEGMIEGKLQDDYMHSLFMLSKKTFFPDEGDEDE